MILIFHYISLLVTYYFSKRKCLNCLNEINSIQENLNSLNSSSSAFKDAEAGLKFDPPVYRQRYGTIHDVLINSKWRKNLKKIVEFGCAELGLFIYIKNLIGITEINFVDIDEDLLEFNKFRVTPLTIEYLKKRSDPLVVNVFAGSIADPDWRILDCDVVVGIEIIEHLYPDVLEAVPYNIFHCIRPKLVIFTTPNADFNELLPGLQGFRHYDHKFEWTREQFQSWAVNISERFPEYFPTFNGIGNGPEGTGSYGCCSQMVLFLRKDLVDSSFILSECSCQNYFKSNNSSVINNRNYCLCCHPLQSYGICTYSSYSKPSEDIKNESRESSDGGKLVFYKLVKTVDFPYEVDDRTPEQKILDEVKYKIYCLGGVNSRFFNGEKSRAEIPLVDLTYSSKGQFISVTEVQNLLLKHGYQLEECQFIFGEDHETQLCLIYEPEMESSSSSESEPLSYESGHSRFVNDTSLSDWDDDWSLNGGECQKVPPVGGVFPEWLLQMLRTNFPADAEVTHSGPHFYCQGDGLGVHPSVLEIDVDENEDASSESSSTNGSAALAGTEDSSVQDIISLPDDDQGLVVRGRNVQSNNSIWGINSNVSTSQWTLQSEESEEYFDTTDQISIVSGKMTK